MADSATEKDRLVADDKTASSSSSSAPAAAASSADDEKSTMVPVNVPTTTPGAQQQQGGARLKVILLGDQAVGKSSIVARFMYDAYDRHYRATLGIDFLTKLVTVDGRTVRLQLWDTAGQERFRSLIPSYIRNSAGAIVVFDVSSRESFLNTTKWIEDVQQERGTDSGVVFFLVGNKIDLGDKRAVTTEEGEAKAREIGATYQEVSAKVGTNIKSLFRKVSTTIPLPPLESDGTGGAGGGVGGGGGGGLGAAGGSHLPPVRRIDPLLVTPSRQANAAAARAAGEQSESAGYCSYC